MMAAAPGILHINNRALSDDLADELTHWIANRELQPLLNEPRPMPWHDFARALLTTSPIRRGRAQLLRGLNEWKNSIYQVELQLVYIVEEPEEQDPEDAAWPIRVRVRSGTDSPRPVLAGADTLPTVPPIWRTTACCCAVSDGSSAEKS